MYKRNIRKGHIKKFEKNVRYMSTKRNFTLILVNHVKLFVYCTLLSIIK